MIIYYMIFIIYGLLGLLDLLYLLNYLVIITIKKEKQNNTDLESVQGNPVLIQ